MIKKELIMEHRFHKSYLYTLQCTFIKLTMVDKKSGGMLRGQYVAPWSFKVRYILNLATTVAEFSRNFFGGFYDINNCVSLNKKRNSVF